MSIYVTGDIHRRIERFSQDNFNNKNIDVKVNDIFIVCGDFGIPWYLEDMQRLDRLKLKPYIFLFVDGNHENFDLLNKFPVIEKFGGKVHKLCDNVFHLMRGEVFEIEGKTFFSFGGATSTDQELRTEHITWWKEENFSYAEFENAVNNLEKVGFKVDYVISHTAPKRFIENVTEAVERVENCKTSKMLTEIEPLIYYKKWYFGHFHLDYYREDSVAAWMYKDIVKI